MNATIVAYIHFTKRGRKPQRAAMARQLSSYAIASIVDNHLVAAQFEAMSGNEQAAAQNVAGMMAGVAAEHGLVIERVEFEDFSTGWGWSTLETGG